MKVFSQVSTIPGGPVKQKLVVCCSHKRTAAQYAIRALSYTMVYIYIFTFDAIYALS